jgi:hypothetical protein
VTTKTTHVYGIWFVPSADDTVDWMAQLYVEDGKWTLSYRFRYYSPDSTNPHDGKDEKSWYYAQANDDSDSAREAVVAALNQLMPKLEEELGGKAEFVLLDCKPGDPKILFELGSRPWAHVRMATAEEKKEILGEEAANA